MKLRLIDRCWPTLIRVEKYFQIGFFLYSDVLPGRNLVSCIRNSSNEFKIQWVFFRFDQDGSNKIILKRQACRPADCYLEYRSVPDWESSICTIVRDSLHGRDKILRWKDECESSEYEIYIFINVTKEMGPKYCKKRSISVTSRVLYIFAALNFPQTRKYPQLNYYLS